MPFARNGATELCFEVAGDPAGHPLLMVSGYTAQLCSWPDGLVDAFVAAGCFVVRFDNRDAGCSSRTPPPAPSLGDVVSGAVRAPYLLADMALDALAVLDAVGIDRAHVWGSSMGGMIAQTLAIDHPDRVRSLTSVMSTTGNPRVGMPSPEALHALRAPMPTDREGFIEATVARGRVTNGPLVDPEQLRVRAAREYDRGYSDEAGAFQMAAIVASGDRTERLRGLQVPTTVIHGACDPLIAPSGGEATAAAIPGARLVMLELMGHNQPARYWPTYTAELERLF